MPKPTWYDPHKKESLAFSTPRHRWMCEQLLARRRLQANGKTVFAWLHDAVESALGAALDPTRVFEVLSDGLGYMEPNWHAIDFNGSQPDGSSDANQISDLQRRIKEMRERYRDRLSKFPTQRAIGGRLYESGLFLVTDKMAYFLHDGNWKKVENSDLPLKFELEATDSELERRTIDASLKLLSSDVLWPAFFENEHGHFFSLVFLHTSLWQSVAGVWALHGCCHKSLMPPHLRNEMALRRLVDPALRCLEDVVGWANEHEGSQPARRRNVDLFFRATGRQEPEWTVDGVRGLFDDTDREIYELAPSQVGAQDSREIFTRAVRALADRSDVHCPSAEASQNIKKIVGWLEAAFVAGRLAEQLPPAQATDAHVPSLPNLMLEYLRRETEFFRSALSSERRTDDADALARALAKAVAQLPDADWRGWCAIAFRVLCLAGFGGSDLKEQATAETRADKLLARLLA